MTRVQFFRIAHIVAALAMAPFGAQAGAVSATSASLGATIDISDSGGYGWSLNLGSALVLNAGTGAITTDTGSTPLVTGTDTGAWSVVSNATQVYDIAKHGWTSQDGLQWHSWMRDDGTIGTDTAGGTNPWRSVVTFAAGGNLDPFMTYGVSFKNTTSATQTYTYTQGEALDAPISGDYQVHAEVLGSLNNAPSSGNVAIAPLASSTHIQVLNLGNSGLASTNAGVDVGPGMVKSATGVSNYAQADGSAFAADAVGNGTFDYWAFQTSFTLTGQKDVATLSGYAEITPVPETNRIVLTLVGLCWVVGLALRRHVS